MSRYRLRPVHPFERAVIYEWRNHPRVRRVMPNTNIIDEEVHKDWWPGAMGDPARRMLMLDVGDVPTALIVFFEVKPGASAKWGFYAAPGRDSVANALAMWMTAEVAAIAYAFDYLRLETLYCETLESNWGVLLLHDRIGFKDTGQILAGFVQKSFSRSGYKLCPEDPLFAQLSEVAIEADPRDFHGPE
jgi:UDP-4-amino-4,6-dideoxy-N-acetyl-beta-L-altrosamine N-acetyltransferase